MTKAGFLVRPIEEVSRASVMLAACDSGETAREDERLDNDIYTHFLVEALRVGVDRNGDGAVTVSEAHDYARRMTYEYTAGKQRPTAETDRGRRRCHRPGGPRSAGRAAPSSSATPRRWTASRSASTGAPWPSSRGGVALDSGRHQVQLAKGAAAALLDPAVARDPGERVDVEALLVRAAGRVEVAPRLAMLGFLDRTQPPPHPRPGPRRRRRDDLPRVAHGGDGPALRRDHRVGPLTARDPRRAGERPVRRADGRRLAAVAGPTGVAGERRADGRSPPLRALDPAPLRRGVHSGAGELLNGDALARHAGSGGADASQSRLSLGGAAP